MKAMILAAGLGTRLAPFTDTKPKVLLPVAGYTLLEISIRYLKKHGIDELVINVHHHADQVIRYLEQNKGFGLPYHISDETDLLLNTGGAIVKAKKYFENEESFVLTGSDILTDLDLGAMIRYHQRYDPLATLAVKNRNTSRSLMFDDKYQLVGWRDNESGETKGVNNSNSKHQLGFSTIHVIDTAMFKFIREEGPFNIMDLYLRLMDDQIIRGFRHDDTGWIEFGRTERLPEIVGSPEFQRMIRLI